MVLVPLLAAVLVLAAPAARAEATCPPLGKASCESLRQWHELNEWEPVWRAGLEGAGVVVVFVDRGGERGASCKQGGARWKNAGEIQCRDGRDDDANGCIDDCLGCNFAPDNDPNTPHGAYRQGYYPFQCYDMLDFVSNGGGLLANSRDHERPGRYPAVEIFTVVYPPGRGAEVAEYLKRIVAANDGEPLPRKRFVIVQRARPGYRQPLTQEDCNRFAERPPAGVPADWFADLEALGEIENAVLVVGWNGGDRFWPACQDPARWLAMGLLRAPGGKPENQQPNPIPSSRMKDVTGYYQLSGPAQDPELYPNIELPLTDVEGRPLLDDHGAPVRYHPLKRFVGYSGLEGRSFHSWQYLATLTYVIPMLQVSAAAKLPTEDEIREIWLRCAPRTGDQRGPDAVGGWDSAVGYGQPSIACSVLEASRGFGGDIDGDGVRDGAPDHDNCPWVANPDQADERTPGGPGDACDP